MYNLKLLKAREAGDCLSLRLKPAKRATERHRRCRLKRPAKRSPEYNYFALSLKKL
jgi:hypothetical protein